MNTDIITHVNDFNWYTWVNQELYMFDTVLELGAGFFDRLAIIKNSTARKIGIEIFSPYIENARFKDCIMISGDMRHYRILTKKWWTGSKAAMFFDSLEHIDMDSAIVLVKQLKEDFDKIIFMVPRGNCPQDKDVTGYDNHEGQTHKSTWNDADIIGIGMTNILVDDNFHKDSLTDEKGCYFAKWEK